MRGRALAARAEVASASIAAAASASGEGPRGWEVTGDVLQRDASWDDRRAAPGTPPQQEEDPHRAPPPEAPAAPPQYPLAEFYPRSPEVDRGDGGATAGCSRGGGSSDARESPPSASSGRDGSPWLFALPAECNFSGARLDLDLIPALQASTGVSVFCSVSFSEDSKLSAVASEGSVS